MTASTAVNSAETLSRNLMVAVVRSGAVRNTDHDIAIATKVMKEEMIAFLTGDKYRDERSIALTGGHNLAWASLVAATISRILAERA